MLLKGEEHLKARKEEQTVSLGSNLQRGRPLNKPKVCSVWEMKGAG